LNQAVGIHCHSFRSFAARPASPRCSATRTAPSVIDSFEAVALIEALSTATDCSTSRLPRRQTCQMTGDLASRQGFRRRLARNRLGKIIDIDEHPAAAPAQRVDQLIARDREQPRREWRIGVPGLPLQMHCEQNVLHNILGLIGRLSGSCQTTPRTSRSTGVTDFRRR